MVLKDLLHCLAALMEGLREVGWVSFELKKPQNLPNKMSAKLIETGKFAATGKGSG
jgi:hypothetical protein